MIGISRGRGLSTLVSIQYLRAFAAFIVVYYHIFSNRVAEDWSGGRNIGLSGVDIFFVISGFIMWTSTNHRGGLVKFLKRRIYRVYPMWWIALTLWIVIRLILPDRLQNKDITVETLICSYLLVPHFHHVFVGQVWPILVPGWTLQIEIFFYGIFSATLLIADRTTRLTTVVVALCVFAILGSMFPAGSALLQIYTSPLLLEFAAGAILAAIMLNLQRAPFGVGVIVVMIGLVLLVFNYRLIVEEGVRRVLVLGIPAILIVAGSLAIEPVLARRPSRILLLFGDASYSLYLTHSVAISAAAVIWERLHMPMGRSVGAIGFIPFALVASLVFAVIVYRFVEVPILAKLLPSRSGVHIAALPEATMYDEPLAEPSATLPSDK